MNASSPPLLPMPGGRVLDVATGRGGSIQFLIENLSAYDEIIAIDVQKVDDATLQAFAGKPVCFLEMDAAHLDFPDQSFDTVFIANSLHHLPDLPLALAEIKRVLKPGGCFAVLEMVCDGQAETQLTHVYLHHWWAAVDTARGISHNETFTRRQLLDLVNSLGLQAVAMQELCDLSDDPRAVEQVQYLDRIIDLYLQRAEGLPEQNKLSQRGEALRQRLHAIGFDSATALLIVSRKS